MTKKKSVASRYFHTLRHLRPVQFYGRIEHKLSKTTIDTTPAPELRVARADLTSPARMKASLVAAKNGALTFNFLNQRNSIATPQDWNNPDVDKLWLYNLHYFDDLNAKDYPARTEHHDVYITKWINENAAPQGNGWEPYPLSLRMVNWVKWFLSAQQTKPFWIDSLALQARVLMQRLEHHLLGNHLFANAKALVFVGLYFKGDEAERWLNKGIAILDREILEQVLKDGGNFELTPMYHSIMLMDMLDLINISRVYKHPALEKRIPTWVEVVEKMVDWLKVMCHPDKEISFFNDAAMGIAPTPEDLIKYAGKLQIEPAQSSLKNIHQLKKSGYIRLENDHAVALLDVAKVGPDYIPGHAHADSLSFELSLFGQRILVNSGTSCYGLGTERLRQRGTAAHNTVIIDNQDSSEVWSGFRVARRAYPANLKVDSDNLEVSCEHTGYRWLKNKPRHQRHWKLETNQLIVTDIITGSYSSALAYLHLHPDIKAKKDNKMISLQLPDSKIVLIRSTGDIKIESSSWHPEFGISQKSQCLIINIEKNKNQITFDFGQE
ncbi:heparinase II/III family protein [Endozoicomonadaceae bacterium StTr2]